MHRWFNERISIMRAASQPGASPGTRAGKLNRPYDFDAKRRFHQLLSSFGSSSHWERACLGDHLCQVLSVQQAILSKR